MAIATNFNTSSSISAPLAYGSEEHKVGATLSVNCSPDNPARDFSTPFEIYGKGNDKVKLHRLVIAFANKNDGNSELNDKDSQEYVRKFLEVTDNHLGGNYPMIAYQNLNTEQNHFHIYIGACGFDGKKLHPKQNPITFSRRLNSSLAMQYGLKQMPQYNRDYRNYRQFTDEQVKTYRNRHNGQNPYAYKDSARKLISHAILNSSDLNSFNKRMNEQNCRVSNNLYSNSKMLNIYIPYRYQNGERKKGQPFRNMRTRTLGKYFTKSRIKHAIYSSSNNDYVLDKYRFFSQGSVYDFDNQSTNISADKRMKGVDYRDGRLNLINQIASSSKRIRKQGEGTQRNAKRIDSNSIKIRKQESNYRRHAPQIRKTPKPSQTLTPQPNLNGLSQLEREQVLEDEKFLKALSELIDDLLDNVNSLVDNRKNHHTDTRSSFIEKYQKQQRDKHKKQAHQRQIDSKASSNVNPNISRKYHSLKIHNENNRKPKLH